MNKDNKKPNRITSMDPEDYVYNDDYDHDLIEGNDPETYKLLFEWFEPWLPGDED